LNANTSIIQDDEIRKIIKGGFGLYRKGVSGKQLIEYLKTSPILAPDIQSGLPLIL
jgi:ABC-type spermidine/putrescine transport system permease subunit II